MGRYLGLLGTDAHKYAYEEMRVGRYVFTAEDTIAASADGLLDGEAMSTTAVKVVTEFENEFPPYPRQLVVTGGAGRTEDVTIHGTDIGNAPLVEVVTLDGATPVPTVNAFKSVEKVVLAKAGGSGTVNLGWTDYLGSPFAFNVAPMAFARIGATVKTAPTFTIDAVLSKNLIKFNDALDGTAVELTIII